MDPNSENFCAYFTPLPTLGGTNASFGAINNLGAESGYAENKHRYPIAVPVWQSAAPALRSSTLNPSYGDQGQDTSANFLSSPAIQSEWPWDSMISDKPQVEPAHATTP